MLPLRNKDALPGLLTFIHLHHCLWFRLIPRDKQSCISKQRVRIVIYWCAFNFCDRKPCILLTAVERLFDQAIDRQTFDIPRVGRVRRRIFRSVPNESWTNLFGGAACSSVLGVLSQGVSRDTCGAALIYRTMHPVLIYQTIRYSLLQ